MCASTTCPLLSSTRNIAFGRASTTEPSTSMTPSFLAMFLRRCFLARVPPTTSPSGDALSGPSPRQCHHGFPARPLGKSAPDRLAHRLLRIRQATREPPCEIEHDCGVSAHTADRQLGRRLSEADAARSRRGPAPRLRHRRRSEPIRRREPGPPCAPTGLRAIHQRSPPSTRRRAPRPRALPE